MSGQILACDTAALRAGNSAWTGREIVQQPRVWQAAFAAIEDDKAAIDAWLHPLLAQPALRIVLCGAGTSSFIGATLAPWLRYRLRRRIDVLSTTDIVADPHQSFAEDIPTLMISCARSGNSPESAASIDLANRLLTDCHHLLLTCNPDGLLAQAGCQNARVLCLLMPKDTCDRGFAMTSSFTTMLVACTAIFTPNREQLTRAAALTEQVIAHQAGLVRKLAERKWSRLVVLGTGCLFGIAREAALKCLELSAGQVVSIPDTPLGFRHGPKSVVDNHTLIIHLQSVNPHSACYERDLLDELLRDYNREQIVTLSPSSLKLPENALDEFWIALPYLVYCQMFAFFTALSLGIGADNPCPTGEVNRVVQGVRIYDHAKGCESGDAGRAAVIQPC